MKTRAEPVGTACRKSPVSELGDEIHYYLPAVSPQKYGNFYANKNRKEKFSRRASIPTKSLIISTEESTARVATVSEVPPDVSNDMGFFTG